MTVEEHYEKHLANFYAWMIGDFEEKRVDFQSFLQENQVRPASTKVALDLGAGHGIQSLALLNLGFEVTAIDFNLQLLEELKTNIRGKNIDLIHADICDVLEFKNLNPELILCCGDTLTHLENKSTIERFIQDCYTTLNDKGKLLLSFRDYSHELTDKQRFIPVKNDENRILTCILEYGSEKVKVTDLLHEKIENQWVQKVSTYEKVRLTTDDVVKMLEQTSMEISFNQTHNRMQTIIAEK